MVRKRLLPRTRTDKSVCHPNKLCKRFQEMLAIFTSTTTQSLVAGHVSVHPDFWKVYESSCRLTNVSHDIIDALAKFVVEYIRQCQLEGASMY